MLLQTVKSERGGDLFKVSKKVFEAPGPFITFRSICRKAHAISDTVVTAMDKLEKESLGTVNQELKCFYKAILIMVTEESLQLYDIDIVAYSQSFRKVDKSISPNQWDLLMHSAPNQLALARYFPNENRASN